MISDMENNLVAATRGLLKSLLKENVMNITFRKTDGTVREVTCTLKPDSLPPFEKKEKSIAKAKSQEVLAVWDIKKEAFRSFRVEGLIQAELAPSWPDPRNEIC